MSTPAPTATLIPDPLTATLDPQAVLGVLKPILEDFPVGVVIVDAHGRFTVFNAEAQRILGLGARDVPVTAWPAEYGCYLPDTTTPYPADRMPLARALRGEAVDGELMFVRNRQLGARWIRISCRPLPHMSPEHGSAVAVFADVTDQRKAVEEVELLSRAVERTADSVIITDRLGEITYVNGAFEATTGYTRAEVMGKTPRILKSGLHEEGFYRALWARLLEGKPFQGTLRNRKKDGDLYWAEQTIAPIFGDTGEITHFVSVLKDITESRRQQEEQIKMSLARDVQQRLYARTVALPGLDVGTVVHPVGQTGGDYVDFITTPDDAHDALGVAVGDVGGHGFDAALVMALTRAYVRSFCQQGLGVGKVLNGVNRMLVHDLEEGRFVTLLLAHLDLGNRMLSYGSAGHVPGFVLGESGDVEAMLGSTGIPLGIFDTSRFATTFLPVRPGQVVVLLTDGATEAGEPDQFGLERAVAYVRAHRDEPGQRIAEGLYDAIRAFTNGDALHDDIALVVLKIE